jgi:hypothetical protein
MTLEEIVALSVPYFEYVFRVLREKYRLEIRWELDVKPSVDSTLVGGEKLVRETFELRIYMVGKGSARVSGITRYYVEIEKSNRKEYIGFRLASPEEIEEKIRRFL